MAEGVLDEAAAAFYFAAIGRDGRQDLRGALDRLQKGRELSVRIRRGEVDVKDLWHGLSGTKVSPSDTYRYPDDPESLKEFMRQLAELDLEGDAIAELLVHGLGKSVRIAVTALKAYGYEAEELPLAPGDYPMLDVRRFPKEIGDSWPDNCWMLVMEECNALTTAQIHLEERPWQAILTGQQDLLPEAVRNEWWKKLTGDDYKTE